MKKRPKAKLEISHKELNLKVGSMLISGRYTPKGFEKDNMKLADKVIFPINVCPFCGSQATYHKIVQHNDDIVGNVWKVGFCNEENGQAYSKFDFCFDCQREFVIELYLWKKIKKEIKK